MNETDEELARRIFAVMRPGVEWDGDDPFHFIARQKATNLARLARLHFSDPASAGTLEAPFMSERCLDLHFLTITRGLEITSRTVR